MTSDDRMRRQFARAMARETFKRNYWNDELKADVLAANGNRAEERARMVEAKKLEWERKARAAAQERARVAAVIAAKKAEMTATSTPAEDATGLAVAQQSTPPCQSDRNAARRRAAIARVGGFIPERFAPNLNQIATEGSRRVHVAYDQF